MGTSSEAESIFLQGNAFLQNRDDANAATCFRVALSIDPLLAEAHANLGWVLAAKGATEEADALYRRALFLSSSDSRIRLNYGAFLAKLKRFGAAERVYLGAIDLASQRPAAWSNLAVLYTQMQRYEEAERASKKSLDLDPEYRNAHVNLAYLLLRQGRFEDGFRHFEWRPWQARLQDAAGCPPWQGQPLDGRRLLIGHEGGFGDAIQFSRYVPILAATGRVTLVTPRALVPLMRSLRGVESVVALEDPAPGEWDFCTSLMSLPHLLRTRLDSIPDALPYLSAPSSCGQRVASKPTGCHVGLAWRGNPTSRTTRIARSMLACWARCRASTAPASSACTKTPRRRSSPLPGFPCSTSRHSKTSRKPRP